MIDSAPVVTSRTRTPVTIPWETSRTSRISLFQAKAILGFSKAFSCMILEARRVSRRWTTVTLLANRVRKRASSRAVSPPPATTISRPLKKNPSQVAQADTPAPMRAFSEESPRNLAEAPVATITVQERISRPSSVVIEKPPSGDFSIFSTMAVSMRAPKRVTWARIFSMSSGPVIPSGNPGKFSTSVVMVSCPPAWGPSITSGDKKARAV